MITSPRIAATSPGSDPISRREDAIWIGWPQLCIRATRARHCTGFDGAARNAARVLRVALLMSSMLRSIRPAAKVYLLLAALLYVGGAPGGAWVHFHTPGADYSDARHTDPEEAPHSGSDAGCLFCIVAAGCGLSAPIDLTRALVIAALVLPDRSVGFVASSFLPPQARAPPAG